jgi:REP element-mobilizing transposase RayT
MPRAMRVEYPGAIYHVMDRGDRREDIFVDDVDRQDLLKTLAEACRKTDWQVPAYCLMRNHFHLVLETPHANLVEGMRGFLSAYTIRLNHRQKLFGHVFSGRCLGSEEFRQQMLERMDGRLGDGHSGELRRQSAEQRANRIVSEELLCRGWKESDLSTRRRSDPGKLAIAARLRSETTLPIKWIAARVQIGTAKGAKTLLHYLPHGQHPRKTSSATKQCAQLEFQSTV